ncbi:ATP-dependent DNA helicase RecG [Variovorax atrisoli]|uniref:ATP-dependent DNA helicase RecG n=1 Tax=Variovorax atrisoli TaxID=3394203 RepID=UPI003AAC5F2C
MSQVQRALRKLGLVRDIDFALYLPMRYEDETRIVRIADTRDGDMAQVEGVVTECEVVYRPRRQLIATIDDGSDTCQLRFFNFYPSQQKQLAVGARVRVRGEMRGGFVGRQIMHPTVKAAGTALPNALTPVYSTVAGLPQPVLRREVRSGLARAVLDDRFRGRGTSARGSRDRTPRSVSAARGTCTLTFLHYPTPDVAIATLEDHSHPAWQRIKAEELLAQQLSQLQARMERAAQRAPVLPPVAPEPTRPRCIRSCSPCCPSPHGCAAARRRGDHARPRPRDPDAPPAAGRRGLGQDRGGRARGGALHRRGLPVCADGTHRDPRRPALRQARRLARSAARRARPAGVAWLTGSQKKKERDEMSAAVESGQAALVIGTHAVISEKVRFKSLALAIIDEQHRFGVAQRLALRGKAEGHLEPHLLMMSATPIPRTLAMSYYADLDVSTLDELPPGRTPIVTRLVADHRRDEVIDRIHAQIAQGRQVYWVCPLIEESEAVDLRNATETRDELAETLGEPIQVGLLHSRMPTAEKQAVMAAFTANEIQVLVSTTVIEVGVDVPNASLMVIEHAERFGLSQLHQLRGRGARRGGLGVRAALCAGRQRPRRRGGARAAKGDGRDQRRLRDRAARPRDPRSRRIPGRASRARRCCASPTSRPTRCCSTGPVNLRRSCCASTPTSRSGTSTAGWAPRPST